jgi:type VI secretion system protein ImpL
MSSNADWVLQTSTKDDLTLEGSPEQIQKALIAMYKRDYTDEWKQFVQGISVSSFETFRRLLPPWIDWAMRSYHRSVR